jgi:diacylglycerol O-acyltransferase / wax synthase
MSLDRLSPLDASFLAVESPTAHMHVGWAAAFEPPEPGVRRRPRFTELRRHVERRLGRAPRYRQMLRSLPLGIGDPAWVDDPQFDVRRHVIRSQSRHLDEIVDERMSRPLPRDRPLWELTIADRLDDGRIGIVGKAHHCMVDGIAAVELASLLLDPEPDAADPPVELWEATPGPRNRDLVSSALGDFAREQLGLARLSARALSSPGRAIEAAGRARRAAVALADAARPAVPLPRLNPRISPQRRLGMLLRPIDDLLQIKRSFGVKLNDVLLAVCTTGVRNYLRDSGDDPVRPKAMVPVSVRDDDAGAFGNAISFMFVDLPCDEPDADRRLREIHGATAARKDRGGPAGASDVIRSIGLVPSPVRSLVSRLIASPRTFNLVVSNIPGPSETLYMRGCRLAEAYPVVPIADRHALSIGMTSVGEVACFGLYADRESMPDVDALTTQIDGAIDELLELTPRARPSLDRLSVPVG